MGVEHNSSGRDRPLILATNEGMNEQTNKHRHKLTNYTTIVNFKETAS